MNIVIVTSFLYITHPLFLSWGIVADSNTLVEMKTATPNFLYCPSVVLAGASTLQVLPIQLLSLS